MNVKMATRFSVIFFFIFLSTLGVQAQTGTEFWFAPPDITDLHNSPGGEPLYLMLSSTGTAATVTVSQPANAAFNGGAPIVVNVPANQSVRVNLTSLKSQLETQPTNSVLNTGLKIESTSTITCYYECANTNNTDIWALKGPNGLGYEFYIPLHRHAPFYNHTFASPHPAFASFDICATQNNTVVTIYSPTPVDGHAALQQFQITLNAGQTYSCGFTGTNYTDPTTHPSGAVVLSDKPITVSLKDDSDHNPSGGCYDILGDQLVPVDVVGEDYIAVKGNLNNNGDESVVLMATQNNTQVFIDGSTTPAATLFAGEYFRIDLDYLSTSGDNSTYIHCTQPTYAMHITGFGCEMGMAQLPPLNCAGSQTLNFVRGNNQTFYLTLLCRTPAIGAFTVTGSGTATIPSSAFVPVPGTAGEWQAARISYNTTEVPVDSTFNITNSVDVFAMGVVNGGASTGCKYGYFSEFVAPITAFAGIDQTICANTSATLSGSVAGGSTTGIWTSTGTGSFSPSNTDLNAVYTPSAGDASLGSVVITLTSTGACTPVSDQMTLTITPAPSVNAGANQTVCANNANISLSGAITVATGGVWTGGAGTYIPSNNVLNPEYIPTPAEIASGSLLLTLTTTGNGICSETSDNILITFTPAPVVNAGVDQTKCGNNATTTLNGSISIASGGVWTGGSGSFSPSATTLNATYSPSASEIAAGSVTLTLTSTGNGLCLQMQDQMTIFFTAPPTANAGIDQTKCANNAATVLSGSVTISTGGQWSGGLGLFSPSTTALGATYTPTAGEIANGSVTLTLTTTGNGSCGAVTDQMTIFFTPAPTVNAGTDIVVCANNVQASLNASYTVASGILWSGGAGTYSPSNTAPNAVYTPSAAEIATGSVSLTCTTTGNGTCAQVSDIVLITITPSPVVNAGLNIAACANNASVSLNGQVFNANGGIWSGGGGSFAPSATSLSATYTPSASEIVSGSVTLTLTSTGNAFCNAVSDDVMITFAPAPVVNAGTDQTVCGNNAQVNLVGFVNFASGGQWSGGLGNFSPSNNALNASYTPTETEVANGFVDLILTSVGNGTCVAVTDIVRINYTPAPTANAGLNLTSCENNADAILNGSTTIATGGVWSGGSGNFVPSNTSLTATYEPTATEIANGSVTLTLTTTGNGQCLPVSDQVELIIVEAPTVNAGQDQTICVDDLDVLLSGSIAGPTNSGLWSTSGSGTFVPNNTSLNAIYQCSAADSLIGQVTLTLTSTNNASCNAVSDQMTIFILPAGIASAGSDVTVCSNNAEVDLNGIVSGGATAGTWSSSGNGSFVPDVNTLDATYVPSLFDIANGSVVLTLNANSCNTAADNLTITIVASPIVDAGADLSFCPNEGSVSLNGTVTSANGTGVWTSTGTGTFSPNNTSLLANYTPSAADIALGQVTFTLTSTNNGICAASSDELVLTINQLGQAFAGNDQSACSNNANISLSGSLTGGATTGEWTTSGDGLFIPNAFDPQAIYAAGGADLIVGEVTLTWATTNSCNTDDDDMQITYTPAPSVNAGEDLYYCGVSPSFALNATFQNSTGVIWSGGNGIFSPSNTSPTAIYTPTAAEMAIGIVTLTLSTTGNGNCNAVSDQMVLTMSSGIQVEAGQDQEVCITAPFTQLNGIISNGTSTGTWTTLGSGTFSPDANALNALYYFSEADTTAGSVTLILTSTNNGACPAVEDIVTITFGESALALAGVDQTICENETSIALEGLISGGASQGQWTTTGNGSFSSNTDLNAVYTLDASDYLNGTVSFTLTTTDNGTCIAGSDEVLYTILPVSTVNAGSDMSVCASETSIPLGGSISGASTSGFWTSNGSGTFSPDNSWGPNTVYMPSAGDIVLGTISLTLTASNTQACTPSTDELNITLIQESTVSAGEDVTLCATNTTVQLHGIIGGGSDALYWTTNGSGSFDDNANADPNYTFSNSDLNSGLVQFVLHAVSIGSCPEATDTVLVALQTPSVVSAGQDISICAIETEITLGGSVNGASTSGQWTSSGTGNFSPEQTFGIATSYVFSNQDYQNGSVALTLSATNTGACAPSVDDIIVTLIPELTVDAGADLSACALVDSIAVNASATGDYSGIQWITSGTGYFSPDANSASTYYVFGATDENVTSIELIATAFSNGVCPSVSDTTILVLNTISGANAGADQLVCSTQEEIILTGIINGTTSTGTWTTSGSGFFSPDNQFSSSPVYIPSQADIDAGSVELMLTSANTGSCSIAADTTVISFETPSVVQAGNDQTVCAIDGMVNLTGIITGDNTTGIWTSSGSGTFGDINALSTAYTISSVDIIIEEINLVLQSSGNNACPTAADTLTIFILPTTTVLAGSDQTICSDESSIDLSGLINGLSTSGVWTTTGSGSFTPNATELVTTYQLSTADLLSEEFIIYLTTTDHLECGSAMDSIIVTIGQSPLAAFSVYSGDSLNIEFTDESINTASWLWDFGNGATSTQQSPTLIYGEAGVYDIQLIVYSPAGCTDTLNTFVEAYDKTLPPIALPTAFSPNGDNNNDILHILGGPYETVEFKVYNGWGNMVFSTTDPKGGWDGTYQGQDQPIGVYVCTVSGITPDGKLLKLSGNITLIR
jgi:gliding motility-associated-like protein